MTESNEGRREVDEFILEQIETVPHLEALLLLWHSRPKPWSVDEMAQRLFLGPSTVRDILLDLARRGLIRTIAAALETYQYESEPGRDRLMALVALTYREDLIRLSRLIHSKPSAAVRDFARAFRLKKENY